MPSIIRILPDTIANQIAAGEVVQRPESVVKELIENSVDAGALHITVIIKESGKSFIQVVDTGAGMTADDARLSFERHATSKITRQEDLQAIHTLGFRGEALASIASVAQVELKTRQPEDKMGTLIRVEGGQFKTVEPSSFQPGTSITVKNLFFNTPGRRNFLKSDNVEFRHILDTVQKYALIYSDIHWTFISEGETVLDVEPTTPKARVGQIFGKRVEDHLIEVMEKTDLVSIHGFLSKPDIAKKSRGDQYLFINGRSIIHKSIQHAIFQSYGESLPHGLFPFYVVFLTVNPARVDVNVHPTKQEVKFDDERSIYAITMAVMRKALSLQDLVPGFSGGMTVVDRANDVLFDDKLGFVQAQPKTIDRPSSPISNFPYRDPNERVVSLPFPSGSLATGRPADDRQAVGTPQPHGLPEGIRAVGAPEQVLRSFATEVDNSAIGDRRIWQVHNKFIFSQIVTGIMVIDQHVAHERILYEQALKYMEANTPFSQQLLFPYTLDLSPADYELLKTLKDDIARLGFDMKFFSGRTVVLEGVPNDLKAGSEQRILSDILQQYREYEKMGRLKGREVLAASFACRSAIKAGDPLNITEMNTLIDRLFACEHPYTCPHGRPVVIKMSIEDMDKRFGRHLGH